MSFPARQWKGIQFPGEHQSNAARHIIAKHEPIGMRTQTPTQAVLNHSAGVFHYTPEGRRLYDYSSGVLVANLGHNPRRWLQRFTAYLGWPVESLRGPEAEDHEYLPAVTMTAYNGVTPIEVQAVERLAASLQNAPGGRRLDTIMWAASGSEAVHKAIHVCLMRDPTRDMVLATRHGFHGKKGHSNSVTGSETDANRDPRVRFISFPRHEIDDHTFDPAAIPLATYQHELDSLWHQYGARLTCLVTEPYLGGGGSYHPTPAYHQLLETFCRQHDLLLIFDEVQANFGRTGPMYAFEKYGIEPDLVVLGKGLGNGVPVAAVALNQKVASCLKYGEVSDTWSANPLSCAAVMATLDIFEGTSVLEHAQSLTPVFLEGLDRLKSTGLISKVRGEGMVFGIECAACGSLSAKEVALALVQDCYLGEDCVNHTGDGIHLLGPLAEKVLRVSPPLIMTYEEATESLDLLYRVASRLAARLNNDTITPDRALQPVAV